jgi:hypothetical protein
MNTIYHELQVHYNDPDNWTQSGWESSWEPQPEHQDDGLGTGQGIEGSSSGLCGGGHLEPIEKFISSDFQIGESSTSGKNPA